MLEATYAQNFDNQGPYEISVNSVEGQFVENNYGFSPSVTNSYPRVNQNIMDGWKYEIILTIKLTGENLVWKTPFGLTLIFPDGSRYNEILNNESKPLYSNNLYEFRFNVICRRKGWAMIKMYPLEQWDKLNIRNVDFRTSEVCLE